MIYDYARIEPEVVVGILHKNMEDLKRFAREIIQHLDTREANFESEKKDEDLPSA